MITQDFSRVFVTEERKTFEVEPDSKSFSENSLNVLKKRYLKTVNNKVAEEPEDMFRRVAGNIAQAELLYNPELDDVTLKSIEDSFYRMIINLDFLPNSPTLMNAGRELQQLAACFVLPIEDSMDGIFDTVKNAALIHKSGGGTGFSFSRLRPKGDTVKTTGGVASGPISFMKVFNSATEAVKQGGTRRGANMGILEVSHPDIEEFIRAKNENSELTNFNISVAVTDKFMQSVEQNGEFELVNPHSGKTLKKIRAKELMDKITESAWKNGEPGIIFIDRINKYNPTPHVGRIESTNPCGEQPLLPNEVCNLGSINLAKMLKNAVKPEIDFQRLERSVYLAVRFLDNVIDMNRYPLTLIEETTKSNRKIGLGIMGFADMLIHLGVPYNSEEAIAVGEKVISFINMTSKKASSQLAEERGVFKNFHSSIYDFPGGMKLRNATTTTIAPTGTLSIIANCSSGIEPLYAISYVRNVMDNQKLIEVNPLFEKIAKEKKFYSNELMEKIAQSNSIQEFNEIPQDVRKVFVTAHDISTEWHIKMQAVFQKHIDNAVSKTINMPNSATKEDVHNAYKFAYKLGCKGITVYRDGSREFQVLSTGKSAKTGAEEEHDERNITPRSRPVVTIGRTMKIGTGCGNLYVTINEDKNGFCEVFAQMGKSGGCAASQSEATSRLVSLALRCGIDVHSILKQIKGIRCPSPYWDKGNLVLSCPDAIAKCIEKCTTEKITDVTGRAQITKTTTKDIAGMCPGCGNILEYVEDCVLCRFCGYSKCG